MLSDRTHHLRHSSQLAPVDHPEPRAAQRPRTSPTTDEHRRDREAVLHGMAVYNDRREKRASVNVHRPDLQEARVRAFIDALRDRLLAAADAASNVTRRATPPGDERQIPGQEGGPT